MTKPPTLYQIHVISTYFDSLTRRKNIFFFITTGITMVTWDLNDHLQLCMCYTLHVRNSNFVIMASNSIYCIATRLLYTACTDRVVKWDLLVILSTLIPGFVGKLHCFHHDRNHNGNWRPPWSLIALYVLHIARETLEFCNTSYTTDARKVIQFINKLIKRKHHPLLKINVTNETNFFNQIPQKTTPRSRC